MLTTDIDTYTTVRIRDDHWLNAGTVTTPDGESLRWDVWYHRAFDEPPTRRNIRNRLIHQAGLLPEER